MDHIEKIRIIEKVLGGQAKAAAAAGVAHNTWWRWAAGRSTPNIVLIDILYRIYVEGKSDVRTIDPEAEGADRAREETLPQV